MAAPAAAADMPSPPGDGDSDDACSICLSEVFQELSQHRVCTRSVVLVSLPGRSMRAIVPVRCVERI
jgi:hypothetical protein